MKNIQDLFFDEEISARTFNICGSNDLINTESIINYYLKNCTFLKLRNCGNKSNEELTNVFKKFHLDKEITSIKKVYSNEFLSLSQFHKELVTNFLFFTLSDFSNRCKNAFNKNFHGNDIPYNFLRNYELDYNFKDIENVGNKTITELNEIIQKLILFIDNLKLSNNKDSQTISNSILLTRNFPNYQIPSNVLESNSLLIVLNYLIKNSILFEKTETDILENNFKLYRKTKYETVTEISKKNNLTIERIRQIRIKILNELKSRLNFIKDFQDDHFILNQNFSLSYIVNSDNNTETVNAKFGTNFTKQFLSLIFSIVNDKFEIIGDFADVFLVRDISKRSFHEWKNIYLLKKELFITTKTKELIDVIHNTKRNKINTDNEINILDFINSDKNKNTLIQFFKKLVNEEFNLQTINNKIILRRNTRINTFEYPYEALEKLNKESSVKEICEKIIELHPNIEINERSIRASMKRKDGFVPISRTGNFALKKWEVTKIFKGGTLREIVKNYLSEFDEPKKFQTVLEYVQKYRKTTRNSLNHNLKLDESDTFIFFEKSHIGLKEKVYNNEFREYDPLKIDKYSWEESYQKLLTFIQANNQLPKSNPQEENEYKIYRWLNFQKQKFYKNILDNERFQLLNDTILPIDGDFFKIGRNRLLNELLNFVIENNELPFYDNILMDTFEDLETKYKTFQIENNELKYLKKIKEVLRK